MPVLTKDKHKEIIKELSNRYHNLIELLREEEIKSDRQGAPKGKRWTNIDNMCATKGNTYDLELALSDFKSILSIIGKLK